MTRLHLALPLIPLLLAACTPAEQNATIGAIGGAAVGAAVGVAASQLLGPTSTPGQCKYKDQYGNIYVAACQ